jgi:hypothetical protein
MTRRPETPDELARLVDVYHRHSTLRRDQDFWACERVHEIVADADAERAFRLVLELVRSAADHHLQAVGAGAVEKLVKRHAAALIDQIEAEARRDARLREALGSVWLVAEDVPAHVLARLQEASGGTILVSTRAELDAEQRAYLEDVAHGLKGVTSQPVIAERRLVRASDGGPALIRLHAPEVTPPDPRGPSTPPWRCGFWIEGVPGVEEFWGVLEPGEVFFAEGQDALAALVHAVQAFRTALGIAEEKRAIPVTWPLAPLGGHGVPAFVWNFAGPGVERRLVAAMQGEWDAVMAERRRRAAGSGNGDSGSPEDPLG